MAENEDPPAASEETESLIGSEDTSAINSSDVSEPSTIGDTLGLNTELEAVLNVDVEITAVLGTAIMPISQCLKLGRGAVVQLDRGVAENIEIHANNRAVATGEVVVIEERLGVNINKVIKLVEGSMR